MSNLQVRTLQMLQKIRREQTWGGFEKRDDLCGLYLRQTIDNSGSKGRSD